MTGVVTGGDLSARRRTRRRNGRAVRHDVAVFVVSCMAIAEADEAALTMP
jgi:signal recognition particle subunit SEC65